MHNVNPAGQRNRRYTSRLQKGGALLEDMRVLVRSWGDDMPGLLQARGVRDNILAKQSRARVAETYRLAFLPRFVNGNPAEAWRIVRPLEDRHLPNEVVRPVYYWITARSEPLLYDFVTEELFHRRRNQASFIRPDETVTWILNGLASDQSWSPTVAEKVARGLLAALRDFGILEGAAKKKIAPIYLPLQAFVYLAFALHQTGPSGERLVQHPDWRLFLMSSEAVEQRFLEAHRNDLLSYDAAGRIIRIGFPVNTLEEMADVLSQRPN